MRQRPLADLGARVRERPQPVLGILEEVGVYGPRPEAVSGEALPDLMRVLDAVPGEMQCDGWGTTGQLVHPSRIRDPLEHVSRSTRLREHGKPGAGVAKAPGRRLELEARKPPLDFRDIGAAILQLGDQ